MDRGHALDDGSLKTVMEDTSDGSVKKDIVVGVDGSPESFAALRWALREASLDSRHVNAVFGWTRSWSLGPEPQDDDEWDRTRVRISSKLREWADTACQGMDFDRNDLTLTSVHASGASALMTMGSAAQQIVVGRRSVGRMTRWLTGSLSSSLAEDARVPVTIVKTPTDEASTVRQQIARTLSPSRDDATFSSRRADSLPAYDSEESPIVVGVDGSATSRRALRFARDMAALRHRPLRVIMCWQLRDLGTVPGYERAVAPISQAQSYAQQIVERTVHEELPHTGGDIQAYAFHIPAAQGLIDASRYAAHIIVGTRGLSGMDARFLGSVSRQVVDLSECSVTVVH